LTDKTLSALLSAHETNHNDLTLLTAVVDDPRGYGRIIKEAGRVVRIVEQKDCTPDIDAIHEVNAGVYVFDNRELFRCLKNLTPNNAAKEYYLTDVIAMFVEEGRKVASFSIADVNETMGVNDRYQLSVATKCMRDRINKRWMIHGVTFEDPDTAYIGPEVKLSRDTVIRPNVHVLGKSFVGHENIIGPDTYLENVRVGERNTIVCSHLVDTTVEDDTHLGPYLRTRGGTHIRSNACIGNFNELKNADFGEGSHCLHLSYLGDTSIGKEVNVGCGTITANFDGTTKYESEIQDGAFIGCGSVLVSPVKVGERAFVAAGSVITDNVPNEDLAIARSRQENKTGRSPKAKKD
jgi:bifunctional UDP-N-acetylglucosamine pyrophosphorylase/glucosamine-1-phosphate N-acetyltransferase